MKLIDRLGEKWVLGVDERVVEVCGCVSVQSWLMFFHLLHLSLVFPILHYFLEPQDLHFVGVHLWELAFLVSVSLVVFCRLTEILFCQFLRIKVIIFIRIFIATQHLKAVTSHFIPWTATLRFGGRQKLFPIVLSNTNLIRFSTRVADSIWSFDERANLHWC